MQVTAKEANVKYDMLGVAYTLSAFKKNLSTYRILQKCIWIIYFHALWSKNFEIKQMGNDLLDWLLETIYEYQKHILLARPGALIKPSWRATNPAEDQWAAN